MGSFVANPLSGLIEGLLQGHQLGQQLHRQQQEDAAFKTNQALHEQQMSIQDIMNHQLLAKIARPVNNGMVENPAVEGQASPVPGLPNEAGMPSYVRKADSSRTIKYSDGSQHELKTPQEQQQDELNAQIKGNNALEDAKTKADAERNIAQRRNVMALEGGPTRSVGHESVGIPAGTPLTRAEFAAASMEVAKLRTANERKLGTGDTLYQYSPPEAPSPGAASTTDQSMFPEFSAPPLPGYSSALPENLRPQGAAATNQAAPTAPAAPTGLLQGNGTVSRMREIARGGQPPPSPDFGVFLKAAAKARGKSVDDLTPEELGDVRSEFSGEARNPTEASLAWKSVHGKSDLERKAADAALKRLDQSKIAARPVNQFIAPSNAPQGPATIEQVPESIRGTVKAITEYRQAMPTLSRNNPTNQAIQFWVGKVAPQYTATEFPARNKMTSGFTSGSQSKELSGINTALGHVGVLGDAIDALDNGNIQILNRLANAWGVQTGSTPVTTFQAIVHKVAPELNRAYVGGVGSQGEIKSQESDFDPKMGTAQLKNNVAITTKLLRSKIASLENQWKTTMKSDDFEDRFLTPEAKAVANKWSPAAAAGDAPASYAQTATGKDGHKVGTNDGGKTWFDVTTGQKVQ